MLETTIEVISKKTFACEADAVAEWDRFTKKHNKLVYVFVDNKQSDGS